MCREGSEIPFLTMLTLCYFSINSYVHLKTLALCRDLLNESLQYLCAIQSIMEKTWGKNFGMPSASLGQQRKKERQKKVEVRKKLSVRGIERYHFHPRLKTNQHQQQYSPNSHLISKFLFLFLDNHVFVLIPNHLLHQPSSCCWRRENIFWLDR